MSTVDEKRWQLNLVLTSPLLCLLKYSKWVVDSISINLYIHLNNGNESQFLSCMSLRNV